MGDIKQYKKQKKEFLDELNKNFQRSSFLRGYYDFKFADLMKTYKNIKM